MYNNFSKKSKKVIAALLVSALAVSAAPSTSADAAKAVKKTYKIGVGKKATKKVAKKIKSVKTSNKKIVTVKKKGAKKFVLKAKKAGTAKVTVKFGKKTLKATVKVGAKKITKKTFAKTIVVGKTKTVKVTAKNGKKDTIKWSSNKKKVLKVKKAKTTANKKGVATNKITAVAQGTAKITVKSKNTGVKKVFKVTVTGAAVSNGAASGSATTPGAVTPGATTTPSTTPGTSATPSTTPGTTETPETPVVSGSSATMTFKDEKFGALKADNTLYVVSADAVKAVKAGAKEIGYTVIDLTTGAKEDKVTAVEAGKVVKFGEFTCTVEGLKVTVEAEKATVEFVAYNEYTKADEKATLVDGNNTYVITYDELYKVYKAEAGADVEVSYKKNDADAKETVKAGENEVTIDGITAKVFVDKDAKTASVVVLKSGVVLK